MVVSKSRSSASLTVIAPVPELMAKGGVVVVPVGVAAGDGPHVGDVVVAGGRDGRRPLRRRRRSASMVAWVSVTVMATFEIVIVMSSLSALTSSSAWTVSVVGGRGLEVEVVGVVDGDRAGVGVDGEGRRSLSLSASVLPPVMDQVRPSSSAVLASVDDRVGVGDRR